MFQGIRRILEEETGVPHPRDRSLDTSRWGRDEFYDLRFLLWLSLCNYGLTYFGTELSPSRWVLQ